jgi:hypothetical protein
MPHPPKPNGFLLFLGTPSVYGGSGVARNLISVVDDAPDKQVATDFKKDCLGCHIPASSTDWIYIQGYPVLSSK